MDVERVGGDMVPHTPGKHATGKEIVEHCGGRNVPHRHTHTRANMPSASVDTRSVEGVRVGVF